jgi:hypothetical protein
LAATTGSARRLADPAGVSCKLEGQHLVFPREVVERRPAAGKPWARSQ